MSDHDPHGEPTRIDTPVSDPTMAMPAAAGAPPPPVHPATGEPPSEPPDRRPWIIAVLVAAILLLGLVLLVLLDDDDDSGTSAAASTTTSATSTTSSSTTTTASSTTTTAPTTTTTATATTVDPARCVSSDEEDTDEAARVAQVVYEAYTLNDGPCAGNLMTADAIEQLFAIPGQGAGWTFMACEEGEDPQARCSFRFEGGSTTFQLAYDDGWVVYDVFQTPD